MEAGVSMNRVEEAERLLGEMKSYPTLRAEDLANAWAFFRAHADEIERQIRENEEA